ncbi:polysaccharide ABC transporter ATP-binding protein [Pseudomonadota bacterium]
MTGSKLAIKVENISKRYRLGAKEQQYDSFGESLLGLLKSPMKNYQKYRSLYDFSDVEGKTGAGAAGNGGKNVLWAVRDISFDIAEGEVVGIIGTNGAGKSTLLKILSRITPPSTGRIELHGRVSSLLEVGTGFHPELTGRENVYLNGTILGMRKVEVDRVFDEIVDFSGVEKFLDTPVKRYSSGMRVRLAFAVAAHLEPELMIVDEVLAVGDASFQRKCMNKMQEVGESGRTVLFVSHNMQAVTRMCQRVILLDEGKVLKDGTPHNVVSAYLKGESASTAEKLWGTGVSAPGGDVARLRAIRLRAPDGAVTDTVDIRNPTNIEIEYEVIKSGYISMPMFSLWNQEGMVICLAMDQDKEWRSRARAPGRYVSIGTIPGNFLPEGMLTVSTSLWALEPSRSCEYFVRDVLAFHVVDSTEGDSSRGSWLGDLPPVIRPSFDWTTTMLESEAPNR